MFKQQPKQTWQKKVGICAPGSSKPDFVLNVEYRYKRKSEVKEFFEALAGSGKSDVDALMELIVCWSGPDLPDFTEEALTELIDRYPSAAAELFGAFSRETFEAKQKN